jgi:hypothetical protein
MTFLLNVAYLQNPNMAFSLLDDLFSSTYFHKPSAKLLNGFVFHVHSSKSLENAHKLTPYLSKYSHSFMLCDLFKVFLFHQDYAAFDKLVELTKSRNLKLPAKNVSFILSSIENISPEARLTLQSLESTDPPAL